MPGLGRGTALLAGAIAILGASVPAAGDVITKPDGLKIEDTQHVQCDRPTKNGDMVSVHYAGRLENGKQFDASWDRGYPFTFELGKHQVISGWDEGLLDMCVGTSRKLIIPPALGYGARNMGAIPPNSVLIFETKLMHIEGVADPPGANSTDAKGAKAGDTAPDEGKPDEKEQKGQETDAEKPKDGGVDDKDKSGEAPGDSLPAQGNDSPVLSLQKDSNGECRLLGPFALVVQAALGVLALMSLVFKRWRERPRRPLKIWFFDASKQVVGTALLHVANLAMSMLSSGIDAAAHAAKIAEASKSEDEQMPNPCSFYLLNLAIDTTIGIPILVVLLRVLHALFARTPLANPPESLKSGHYGTPPHVSWWIKQSFIYFIGLFGMKLFVLFMFQALPWLPWIGDWALRWTEGNESVQIAFVMFIFPLAMNAIQYYIIDTFIKEKTDAGYQSVQQDDDARSGDDDDNSHVVPRESRDEDEDDEGKPTPVTSAGASSGSDAGDAPKGGASRTNRAEM